MRDIRDFVCWQLANELRCQIIELTATGPASRNFTFRDRIRESSTSATANMSEGFRVFHACAICPIPWLRRWLARGNAESSPQWLGRKTAGRKALSHTQQPRCSSATSDNESDVVKATPGRTRKRNSAISRPRPATVSSSAFGGKQGPAPSATVNSTLSAPSSTLGAGRSTLGAASSTLGEGRSTLGDRSSTLSAASSTLGDSEQHPRRRSAAPSAQRAAPSARAQHPRRRAQHPQRSEPCFIEAVVYRAGSRSPLRAIRLCA